MSNDMYLYRVLHDANDDTWTAELVDLSGWATISTEPRRSAINPYVFVDVWATHLHDAIRQAHDAIIRYEEQS